LGLLRTSDAQAPVATARLKHGSLRDWFGIITEEVFGRRLFPSRNCDFAARLQRPKLRRAAGSGGTISGSCGFFIAADFN
jgi:hypothetical protein